MAELPEIFNLAWQMDVELKGKTIADAEVVQPRCLNCAAEEFRAIVKGKRIGGVTSRGKWIFAGLDKDASLLLNLGMGGDVLYHRPEEKHTGKYKVILGFTDGSSLSINFWWFGHLHAIPNSELGNHTMTATLGISPLDPGFTPEAFRQLLKGKKGTIKALLLDQKIIAGIGNVYAQDILFDALIHPGRKASQLADAEIDSLYKAIVDNIKAAAAKGGLKFEKDLYGNDGGIEGFKVGYREGQPCPVCGTTIRKIKTGSTASYVCLECQK